MPKIIDYTRASLQRSLDLANAVEYLGGSASVQSCADRMNVKLTGSFSALIGAAVKHELITNKKNTLSVTNTFRNIKHAYDNTEKSQNLAKAFLTVPLYAKLYDRFKGKELPIEMLSKILIREFGVEEDMASRVVGYFVEGARLCDLMVNNTVIDIDGNVIATNSEPVHVESIVPEVKSPERIEIISESNDSTDSYIVHITGRGINSKLTVSDVDDFLILQAMLNKLKKNIKNENE